jgi:hypothetical protein
MTTRDLTTPTTSTEYMSKKVIINGQPVTLYSRNGLTWLSSPEEIPDVMARLENTRVLLNDLKSDKDAKEAKGEKGEKGEKSAEKNADQEVALPAAQKPTAARYRMKGPKPRPILRQDGVAITGTPVPVAQLSSSSVQMKVADEETEVEQKNAAASGKQLASKAAPKKPLKVTSTPEAVKKLSKELSKVVVKEKAAKQKGAAPVAKVAATKIQIAKSKFGKKATSTKAAAPAKGSKAAKPAPKAKAVKGKAKSSGKKSK